MPLAGFPPQGHLFLKSEGHSIFKIPSQPLKHLELSRAWVDTLRLKEKIQEGPSRVKHLKLREVASGLSSVDL